MGALSTLALWTWIALSCQVTHAGEKVPALGPLSSEPPATETAHAQDQLADEKDGRGSAGSIATAATACVSEPDSTTAFHLKFSWTNGTVGETTDLAFRFHFGGRFDFDNGWYSAPANVQDSLDNPLLDGTDFRRFRLAADGTIWEQVEFALEADFSRAADFKGFESTPQTNIFITNAWLAVHDLPVLDTVRAGHQKEYLTFANATSSKFYPFMERPYIYDAYENDFS